MASSLCLPLSTLSKLFRHTLLKTRGVFTVCGSMMIYSDGIFIENKDRLLASTPDGVWGRSEGSQRVAPPIEEVDGID